MMNWEPEQIDSLRYFVKALRKATNLGILDFFQEMHPLWNQTKGSYPWPQAQWEKVTGVLGVGSLGLLRSVGWLGCVQALP